MEPDKIGFFKSVQQLVEEYVKERILLLKLQTAEKTARLLSVILAALIFGLLSFFILLFLSLMALYYFASLTGNLYYGFGIIVGFYVFLLILSVYFRKRFYKYFSDMVVRLLFENTDITDAEEV